MVATLLVASVGCSRTKELNKNVQGTKSTEFHSPTTAGESGNGILSDATHPTGGTAAPRDLPPGTPLSGVDNAAPVAAQADQTHTGGAPRESVGRQTAEGAVRPTGNIETGGVGDNTGLATGTGSDGVGGQIPASKLKGGIGTANVGEQDATDQSMGTMGRSGQKGQAENTNPPGPNRR